LEDWEGDEKEKGAKLWNEVWELGGWRLNIGGGKTKEDKRERGGLKNTNFSQWSKKTLRGQKKKVGGYKSHRKRKRKSGRDAKKVVARTNERRR